MPAPADAFAADHFAGQSVLITGGAGGMGLEAGRAFAAHGATVVLTDLDGAAAESGAAAIRASGGKAIAHALDVGNPASIAATFKAVDGEVATLDHVVTCAAIITSARTPGATWEHWH